MNTPDHPSITWGEPETSAAFESMIESLADDLSEKYEQYVKDILSDPEEPAQLKAADRSNEELDFAAREVAADEVTADLNDKYRDDVREILFCG